MTKRESARLADRRRGSARARGYTGAWDKAAKAFRQAHPLCRLCLERGRTVAARVVDHIKPHRGDRDLFWDVKNWQSLCSRCHDSVKQSEERLGYSKEIGNDGWPIDPRHPSNTRH
jgi:5-methylcytosine-specific restriction protein A